MNPVFYKPNNGWVGDLIPYSHNDIFYLFYLHDERKGRTEDDYGFNTSWNLLVTTDGTDVEDKGVVLPAGGPDDIDRSCYTGSVVRDGDGLFHLFYTAQNHENPRFCRDGRSIQYVMHATSRDLLHWDKHYEDAFGADEDIYEVFDWRDPYVYYSEEDGCYNMLLAARQQGASQKNGGCIGLCQSQDLTHWTVRPPFYDPRTYLTHECPDLFHWGDWWYLVYSTFSERFVTHYRMARTPKGPWLAPPQDSFDGRGFYAAKTAEARGERWAFGWVPTKRGNTDYGMWEWGGTLVMHRLHQQADGKLLSGIPFAIRASFSRQQPVVCTAPDFHPDEPYRLDGEDHLAVLPFTGLPGQFLLEADITFSSGIRQFGLGVRQDGEYANGYYFRLEPFHNRAVFDFWPRREPGVNQWYIDGDKPFVLELERPCLLAYKRSVHLRLLADGDIATLYVDDAVALTTRMYRLENHCWSLFAFDGSIEVSGLRLLTRGSSVSQPPPYLNGATPWATTARLNMIE